MCRTPARCRSPASPRTPSWSIGSACSRSSYEGPTGIVGIVHDACRRRGLTSASLWAAVPHYVAAVPNPKAALALLRRLEGFTGVAVEASRARGRDGALRDPGRPGGRLEPGDRGAGPAARGRAGRGARARGSRSPLGRHDRPRLPAIPAPAHRRRAAAAAAADRPRRSPPAAASTCPRDRRDLRRGDAHPGDLRPRAKSVERWRENLDASRRRGAAASCSSPSTKAVRVTRLRARAGRSSERPAYATTARPRSTSTSGRAARASAAALYAELLATARRTSGCAARWAASTQPNPASERLHRSHGFTEVGTFTQRRREARPRLGRALVPAAAAALLERSGLAGGTDEAVVAPGADLVRRAGLEVLVLDPGGDLEHGALDPLGVVGLRRRRRPAGRRARTSSCPVAASIRHASRAPSR